MILTIGWAFYSPFFPNDPTHSLYFTAVMLVVSALIGLIFNLFRRAMGMSPYFAPERENRKLFRVFASLHSLALLGLQIVALSQLAVRLREWFDTGTL